MKKSIKLPVAVILAVCAVLFAFASCGGDGGAEDTGGNSGAAVENGAGTPDPGPEPKSFLKKAETGDRNNYSGAVGYEISVLEDIQVSAVGRPVSGSMDQAHAVYIWEVSSETLLASAAVAPDSPADALGFKTAQLSTQIVLKAGESYRIVCAEYKDGDMWYDIGTSADDPIPDLQPNPEAEITTPVFTGEDAHDSYPSNTYNPGGVRGYAGVTFYYLPPAVG